MFTKNNKRRYLNISSIILSNFNEMYTGRKEKLSERKAYWKKSLAKLHESRTMNVPPIDNKF